MDRKPFVRMGKAGSLKMTGNKISDRPLLQFDEIDGHAEISDNTIASADGGTAESKLFRGWRGWLMVILGGAIASVIATLIIKAF